MKPPDIPYEGPSGAGLRAYPPKEKWDDWVELDSRAWPRRVERHYTLVPTTCFNCESACGLLAYVDRETLEVRKFEGNPEHPGSRGRNCAKGPATLNQVGDPDRILHPLKRVGQRGEGKWARVSWDEALDDIAGRIRAAIQDGRPNEVMYHVGRPGEDGFTERILAAWGVDGHNSHTNVCSSNGRAGYQLWMGLDRPSPDYGNARTIVLVSSHLEAGHYFNPHAQRIMEARQRGAKLIVVDSRLSNTATHADCWLAPRPGTEPLILLAIARHLLETGAWDREFVRQWWNWEEYLACEFPQVERTFERFEQRLRAMYAPYTFEGAAAEAGVSAAAIADAARMVAQAGTALATHCWRSAAAGNEGGWQVSRTLFLLNALTGAIGTPGGTTGNGWNKFVPRPIDVPGHPHTWNELTWPVEYPLAMNELSFLLPHFLKEGRGRLAVYFTRVYNPVWTNPDGCSWMEMLGDESLLGLHVALTPVWSETATFADYVLPMGLGPERHDIHSYETHDAQWIGFRQPVVRVARERLGLACRDTRDANPGEVWEENEFWIDLTWRIDPDGRMGIRRHVESRARPGEKLTVDEYYGYIFEHSVPGLPERAAAERMTPLQYMRKYGVFEIARGTGAAFRDPVPQAELVDLNVDESGRAYTRADKPPSPNVVPFPTPEPDSTGRRPVGVVVSNDVRRGFPTPSGRLEFYSRTLAQWGWGEEAVPGYLRSHVHRDRLEPDQLVLIPTFRVPVQIHTRSANAKWLNEIAHTNPVWLHPSEASARRVRTGDLIRVSTDIGWFVARAWVTEAIRPGVAACSHHMGRWRTMGDGVRQMTARVALSREGTTWRLRRIEGVSAYTSADPDTGRIWWSDPGVHQNLAFPVHPDPLSGMHCWHQAVRIAPADPADQYGDVVVDTAKAHTIYRQWIARSRDARRFSPDGTRRPYWLLRPLKPPKELFALPVGTAGTR